MKLVKRMISVLLTTTLIAVALLFPMEAKAGSTELILDETSLKTSAWHNPEDDVIVEEDRAVFSEQSTDYTRFIAKAQMRQAEYSKYVTNFSASLRFSKLPNGKKFILGFGLKGIEAVPGDAENIEVAFVSDGGVKVGIQYYQEDGTVQTILEPKSCGISLNKVAKVSVDIMTGGKIELSINNNVICSKVLPVSGEGRFGFLQTGGCAVEVSDVMLTHYEYERPQNVNVVEDFEQGGMDISKLTAKMLGTYYAYERGQKVDTYDGNQVLMFRNTGGAYVGTVYPYSNFEMTFDIPYFNVAWGYDEEGILKETATDKMYISIGGEKADWDSIRWELASEVIALEYGTVYSQSNREEYSAELKKNPFESGRPFSMQVRLVDSIVTIGMKWLEETQFQTVLQYKLRGGTPTGHIHIWSASPGNFAIDNIKITNLDANPCLIETEFQNGKIVAPESKPLEPMARVYMKTEETGISQWIMLIPVTAITGVGVLLITVLATGKKKKEREAKLNEV